MASLVADYDDDSDDEADELTTEAVAVDPFAHAQDSEDSDEEAARLEQEVYTLLVCQHYLCGITRVSTLLGAKCWHSTSGTPCLLCFALPALCVCASTTCEPTLLVCHHYLSWTATVASCAEAHSGSVVWTGPWPDVTRPCPLGPEWFKSRSCPILEYFNPGLVQIPEWFKSRSISIPE